MPNFTELILPETLKVSSSGEMIPLEFFGKVIPISKKIQFKLGYFSSNSICTLSYGFAQFIFNGGKIEFLINNFVSDEDYNLLNGKILAEPEFIDRLENLILNDLEKLNDVLTRKQVDHFYNCLRYLIDKNLISIIPVTTSNGEISHYKEALFFDENDNILNIVGSCNFTYKGIVCNGESFVINRSWGASSEKANIKNELKDYELIFSKKSKDFIYLPTDALVNVIHSKSVSKDIKELLENEVELLDIDLENYYSNTEELRLKKISDSLKKDFEKRVEILIATPKFPGGHQPRDYQIQAYENWVQNNYSGVFAMATGTGKTITSLNCLLQEFKKEKAYNAIILVPSIALLNQWEQEVEEFNFQNILKIGGGNNWEQVLANYASNFIWGIKKDLIIISTYGSFITDRFQKYFSKIQADFMLIADEAHNMGASQIKKLLPEINVNKKIALSATPKRIYDPEGTDAIDSFFHDSPPYTYSFPMERALKEERLTEYKYFPRVVELQEEELDKYIEISKRLLRYFDFASGEFKKDPMVEKLLLIRKNIIHKAANKISCFKNIVLELEKQNRLKYIFTYVPEGYVYDDYGDGERMLNHFMRAAISVKNDLKINSYTAEDEDLRGILKGFSEGKIEMVFAMKMLDEGVDVPRAEVGIFCSSTGNPRQFIQRRGRLLRKHNEKAYATIYDMVVVPSINDLRPEFYTMERNQVKAELQRVAYFASLSMNYYDTRRELQFICDKYDLNIDQIIQEL